MNDGPYRAVGSHSNLACSSGHSALSHGGSPPSVPERTRKSFVVHFSALSSHPTRYSAVSEVVDGVGGETVFSTSETVERGGALGFTNPLRGEMLYRR